VNTTAQVGGALGLAVLATLSASRSAHLIGAGRSAEAALTGGYHLAFWIASALVAGAIAVAVLVLRGQGRGERSPALEGDEPVPATAVAIEEQAA